MVKILEFPRNQTAPESLGEDAVGALKIPESKPHPHQVIVDSGCDFGPDFRVRVRFLEFQVIILCKKKIVCFSASPDLYLGSSAPKKE